MVRMVAFVLGLALATTAWSGEPAFHVIPEPQHVVAGEGSFALTRRTTVYAPGDARAQAIARFLRTAIHARTGIALLATRDTARAGIQLRIDPAIRGDEAYHLTVTPARIVIAAATDRGLFWGVQTLRQLLPAGHHAVPRIPAVRIADAPRYPWRSVMLDVSRHFFPVSYIEKQIDVMSYYKFNVLHWHLTDDQGWRIQIKRYPKLTSVGAWRTEADGKRYGGFYTQAQIRAVVAYAKARNIMVVPEIEMPGHTSAAIAAYPELSCSGKPIEVPTTWGVFRNVDCVGKPATYTFLENVLDEVIALFPSPFVHIGGDEVPEGVWSDCSGCAKLAATQGIHGEQALHSYFVGRIGKFLARRGKTLVGWDEILEGGVSPQAVVEVWRGAAGATQALANGNRIIIAGPFYMDASIGSRTLQDLYRNDPFNNPLFAKYPGKVLGGDAPLWAERVQTVENGEAKLYPRVLAIAEHLWNPAADDVADFLRRVDAQYAWLDAQGIAYGPADQDIVDYALSYNPGYHRWRIRAERGFDDMRIRYTTDGSDPTAKSASFGNVLDLYAPATVKAAPFRHGVPYEVSRTFQIVPNVALGKPVAYATPPSPQYSGGALQLVNGLLGSTNFHDGSWSGWQGAPMDATIDLGQSTALHAIDARFLRSLGSWIELPSSVAFETSADGKAWTTQDTIAVTAAPSDPDAMIRDVTWAPATPVTARYVRVVAMPSTTPINGSTPWIFSDELIVR